MLVSWILTPLTPSHQCFSCCRCRYFGAQQVDLSEGRKHMGQIDHVSIIKDYRGKIETELSKICDAILNLLDSHLIHDASLAEPKIFYLKIKGDYHKYLSCGVQVSSG